MILNLLLLNQLAHARVTIGDFYEVGKVSGKPLYVQKTETKLRPDKSTDLTSTIEDAEGHVLMTEQATFSETRVGEQKIEQRQKHEEFELSFKGDQLHIARFKIEDNRRKLLKESNDRITENLITGPVTENFVGAHWDELIKGDTVAARFAVMEICDTVHFDFTKTSLSDKELVVRMKPSGFLIRMITSVAGLGPIDVTFDVQSKHLIRYRGRTPLLDKKQNPLDAEILYREDTTK